MAARAGHRHRAGLPPPRPAAQPALCSLWQAGVTPPPGREPTAWGTTRRLQALMNRGWSARAIQAVSGIPVGQVTAAVRGQRRASRGLDRRVAAAYELLWDQPP